MKKQKGRKIEEKVIELKNEKYRLLQMRGVPLIQKMIELAATLSQEKSNLGIKLALASSTSKKEILLNLEQSELQDVFDVIVSGSDDLESYVDPEGKNKPKPYIYMEVAKRLAYLPFSLPSL